MLTCLKTFRRVLARPSDIQCLIQCLCVASVEAEVAELRHYAAYAWSYAITFPGMAGMLIGVASSVLNILRRAAWPNYAELGRLPFTSIFRDLRRYPEARPVSDSPDHGGAPSPPDCSAHAGPCAPPPASSACAESGSEASYSPKELL